MLITYYVKLDFLLFVSTYLDQVAKGAPSILVFCHLMTKSVLTFELLSALTFSDWFVCLYTICSSYPGHPSPEKLNSGLWAGTPKV